MGSGKAWPASRRQQPVPQTSEDFVTLWGGARQWTHRDRIDKTDGAGQGDGLRSGPW